MQWRRAEVPKAKLSARTQSRCGEHDAALLQELDGSLHALSQPITVLLCTVECCVTMESVDEIKQLLGLAMEASECLRETANAMRTRMRIALEEA